MDIVTIIIIVILCLLSEGFFAGSEIALVSANRMRIKHEAESGSSFAKAIESFLSAPEKLFGTCSLGINLSVVVGTSVVTSLLVARYGDIGDFYAILLMGPMSILLAEIIPKSIFQHRADFFARVSVYPLKGAMFVLYPFVTATSYITKVILSAFPGEVEFKGHFITREEIRHLLRIGEKRLGLDIEERKIIHKIFSFRDITVEECMVPLINLVALEENSTLDMAKRRVAGTNYSRIPVFKEKIYNIYGILNAFDLLRSSEDNTLKTLIKPAYYVPKSKKISELLKELQGLGIQMAVVVDEYGGTIGIVTIEDMLEEIVGEIEDEYDTGERLYEKRSDNTFVIHAQMEIDAINEQLSIKIPRGDYETLGGFLLFQFQRIPKIGDSIEYNGLVFKIIESDNKSIRRVEITQRIADGLQ
jgi:CBS domain containing-hemolysin-like protein